MSELQKRQSELEMELTEATKKECTTKMEVEKLENELGIKTEEITEGKNKIEEIEREANQIKAQIEEIKKDLDLKGQFSSHVQSIRSKSQKWTALSHTGRSLMQMVFQFGITFARPSTFIPKYRLV